MDGVLDLVNFCAQNGHAFQSGTEFSVDDYRIPLKKSQKKRLFWKLIFKPSWPNIHGNLGDWAVTVDEPQLETLWQVQEMM